MGEFCNMWRNFLILTKIVLWTSCIASGIFLINAHSHPCGCYGVTKPRRPMPTACRSKSFLNEPSSAKLSFIFGLFKQTLQCLQPNNVKNVHPVSGAGIQPYNPLNVSLLPQPLDQGCSPQVSVLGTVSRP